MSLFEKLSVHTGLSTADLKRIMTDAPYRYKVYGIPKRNGGVRIISQPAKEVKLVQVALAEVLLKHLPVHPTAMAYRIGKSIKANAAAHADAGPILKMDFSEFFPSIKAADWMDYCRDTQCLTDEEEIFLSSRLMFRKYPGAARLCLAIGAPSSPTLSNLLMFNFDTAIVQHLAAENITYTRYADDLTFSAPRTGYLTGVQRAVRSVLKQIKYPTLQINDKKTVIATKKYSRRITGLTIANDGRVTIGREKKREIFSAVHRFLQGKLSQPEKMSLSGYLAYINAVEPEFLFVLRRKYGEEQVWQIQRIGRSQVPIAKV